MSQLDSSESSLRSTFAPHRAPTKAREKTREELLAALRRAYVRAFGPIPEDATVAPKDGDCTNVMHENLVLVSARDLTRARKRLARAKNRERSRLSRLGRLFRWTSQKIEFLTREYPNQTATVIAQQLGCGVEAVRRKARELGLRGKNFRTAAPIGTESDRIQDSGSVYVKIAATGKWRGQWKLKSHIVWEALHGPVPPKHLLRFKDGNKRNFDPANLECVSVSVNTDREWLHGLRAPVKGGSRG